VRERGEQSGTLSISSDWCVLLASVAPPYIGIGGQGYHHLGGRRGHWASLMGHGPQLLLTLQKKR